MFDTEGFEDCGGLEFEMVSEGLKISKVFNLSEDVAVPKTSMILFLRDRPSSGADLRSGELIATLTAVSVAVRVSRGG